MNITSELRFDREIARNMPRAWSAFFQRFGRLTVVQRSAIPEIRAGKDVLICSATASGKTEAVCAPLVENFIDWQTPWKILYISPTRALVNDLYERLEGPLSSLGLKVARRTGEHHDVSCEKAQVLISTPESFDSMLCRGRTADGHLLASVVAVVLDEIHLLYGTARGEQVCWLLERLRHLKKQACDKGWCKGQSIQILGLSATVTEPEMVRDAFLPGGKILMVAGSRDIEIVIPPEKAVPVEEALITYLEKQTEREKVLVFCNARRRVDDLTNDLGPVLEKMGYEVVAHHGSISQKLRERAEETARQSSAVVIFATSTLEIGIDIGDIDLVVLDKPPYRVSDLLQRIGRGNRRSGLTRVMPCANSPLEAWINTAMLSAANEGWMGDYFPGPQYAVTRQQIASYIMQAPRLSRARNTLENLINSGIPSNIANSILNHMILEKELKVEGQILKLGEYWLDKTNMGVIHTNIEASGGSQVIDEKTGEVLVTDVVFTGDGKWRYVGRMGMKGSSQAQALRHYLGFNDDEWPVLQCNDKLYLFHFGGIRRSLVLRMMYQHSGGGLIGLNDLFLVLSNDNLDKPGWMMSTGPAILSMDLAENMESLEYQMARPWANRNLPFEVRLEEIRGWLRLDEEVASIRNAVLVPVTDQRIEAIMVSIVED
ncbi:MAG: DEAD/DEAH box helicase [Syntrophomonas sp.]